ncbi:RNA pseudouridylate synthase domain-containing protein 2-like [Daphnia pulicaria]|uniref:RNA pseudouridylate synthase domain-containing protein 2-like n=1 Tax=Daphnia pulicaria TaxID=35523 RepID=UPI001EE9EEBF|nr:RNA pseudouridylate synthase domain-containing protein 2-like [Daphnia pulicaria]
MQHPWLLPFLHPLTTAPPIQLTLPPPQHQPHHHPHHHPHQHHHHPHAHHIQQQPQQQPHPHAHHVHHHAAAHQLPSTSMGLTLQPMLTPSGALLLPALQQNAAAAVAAFAAAAHQLAAHQQGSAVAAYSAMAATNSPVLMAPFQPQRSRLKVSERENRPVEANGSAAAVAAMINAGVASEAKRKHHDDQIEPFKDVKRAKIETRALKAKRPGFTDERYSETEYFFENGLRKVYPYYFTFTTFTKGRWVGEKILDVFAREFRAHPVEEYERCIKSGSLTVNYEKVDIDYRLKHNDLLANIVHRHEVPVESKIIEIVYQDDDMIVIDKPCSVPVHPCGRYRHNTVAFILAKEHNLRNLRTIHRLDRLTSGLLMFGRNQEKARQMEVQIRTRLVSKEYVCRVGGEFPSGHIMCTEPIEVVSYKIGVCRVSPKGKDCQTEFERLSYNGKTSVVLCKPRTGRMHQIRVHLQYLGYPIANDPLYNHVVFGPEKGKDGNIGKTDEELIHDLISIHNAENWLGGEGDDFAPNFFSGVIPPEATGVATPSSSSGGMASGVSSRSQTPDAAASKEAPTAVVSLPEFKPNSADTEIEATQDQVSTETLTDPSPLATLSLSPSGAVLESECSVNEKPASPTDNVKSENDGVADDSAVKPEENTDHIDRNSPEAPNKTNDDSAVDSYNSDKVTFDEHCFECKTRFRDPKPKDLMMFLHAWRYKEKVNDSVHSSDSGELKLTSVAKD